MALKVVRDSIEIVNDIIKLVRDNGPSFVTKIMLKTNVSSPMITRYINEMRDSGLIIVEYVTVKPRGSKGILKRRKLVSVTDKGLIVSGLIDRVYSEVRV